MSKRVNLEMDWANSATFELLAIDENGPIDLSGMTLIFTAKNFLTDPDTSAVIQKISPVGINILDQTVPANLGKFELLFIPADTSTLLETVTTLKYDVQLSNGPFIVNTLVKGDLRIDPVATRTLPS